VFPNTFQNISNHRGGLLKEVDNPYLRFFLSLAHLLYLDQLPGLHEDRQLEEWEWNDIARAYYRLGKEREVAVHRFAWAIPNLNALREIARHGSIIELGSGNGYWAWLLRKMGVNILACDPLAAGEPDSYRDEGTTAWTEILAAGPEILSAAAHRERTLFLCWPPPFSSMAADCLKLYQGDRLLYVGEEPGGCCGDEEFEELIKRDWVVEKRVNIPRWPSPLVKDLLFVYRRK